jgi:hypothetical protein
MTLQELAIADALNIASTIHQSREYGYEATAEQITEALQDPRLVEDYRDEHLQMNTRQVARHLVSMAGRGSRGRYGFRDPARGRAIVEQHRRGRWRLTDYGAQVLGA